MDIDEFERRTRLIEQSRILSRLSQKERLTDPTDEELALRARLLGPGIRSDDVEAQRQADTFAFIVIGLVLIGSLLFSIYSPWPARCYDCPAESEVLDH